MAKELTPKERNFKNGILAGKTQMQAYKEAYNCQDWKPQVISNRASELMKKPKIVAILKTEQAELHAELQTELKYNALESANEFDRLKAIAEEKNNINQAIKCEENKGKLAGLYTNNVNIKEEYDLAQGMRDYKNRIARHQEEEEASREKQKQIDCDSKIINLKKVGDGS